MTTPVTDPAPRRENVSRPGEPRGVLDLLPWVLGLALALPTTALLAVGGQSIPTSALLGMACFAGVLASSARRDATSPLAWTGAWWMVVLVGWSVLVTVAAPTLFHGAPVLRPRGGIDEQVLDPDRLTYTVSNVAQLGYLVLGGAAVTLVATRRRLSPHVFLPGLGLAMLLSAWRLLHDLHGLPFPVSLVDNYSSTRYVSTTPTGGYRLRGVFTEPSVLAQYAVAALVLAAVMTPRSRGRWRMAYVLTGTLALVDLWYSGSTKGLVTGLLLVALTAGVAFWQVLTDRAQVLRVALVGLAATVVLLVYSPTVLAYLGRTFTEKRGSSSYSARTTADLFSLGVGIRSWGLGVGLGSNRPSSLWPMVWSCLGVVGLVALAGLLVVVLRGATRLEGRPVFAWMLAAVVLSKSVAGSDLSDPLFQFTLACAAWAATASRRGAGGAAPDTPGPARLPDEPYGAPPAWQKVEVDGRGPYRADLPAAADTRRLQSGTRSS